MYSRSSSISHRIPSLVFAEWPLTVRLVSSQYPQPSLCASEQVGSFTLVSGFADMQAERYSFVQTHIAPIPSARKGF